MALGIPSFSSLSRDTRVAVMSSLIYSGLVVLFPLISVVALALGGSVQTLRDAISAGFILWPLVAGLQLILQARAVKKMPTAADYQADKLSSWCPLIASGISLLITTMGGLGLQGWIFSLGNALFGVVELQLFGLYATRPTAVPAAAPQLNPPATAAGGGGQQTAAGNAPAAQPPAGQPAPQGAGNARGFYRG